MKFSMDAWKKKFWQTNPSRKNRRRGKRPARRAQLETLEVRNLLTTGTFVVPGTSSVSPTVTFTYDPASDAGFQNELYLIVDGVKQSNPIFTQGIDTDEYSEPFQGGTVLEFLLVTGATPAEERRSDTHANYFISAVSDNTSGGGGNISGYFQWEDQNDFDYNDLMFSVEASTYSGNDPIRLYSIVESSTEGGSDSSILRILRTGTDISQPRQVTLYPLGSDGINETLLPADYTLTDSNGNSISNTGNISVTIPANAHSVDLILDPVDDAHPEESEHLRLTLDQYVNPTDFGTMAAAIVHDNDLGVEVISYTPPTETYESGESLEVRFYRNGGAPNTSPVQVNYSISHAGAPAVEFTIEGGDSYSDSTGLGTITIPAGENYAVLTVNPTNNQIVDTDNILSIAVESNASVYEPIGDPVELKLYDDDDYKIRVENYGTSYAYEAGETDAKFRVSRPIGADNSYPITVATSFSGSAVGTDYDLNLGLTPGIGGDVVIPAGSSSVIVIVTAKDDGLAEPDENVYVSINPQSGFQAETGYSSSNIVIKSSEQPSISFIGTDAIANEEPAHDNFGILRFVRDKAHSSSAATFTVNVEGNGKSTASADDFYLVVNGNKTTVAPGQSFDVTIPAGDPTSDILIYAKNDALREYDDYLTFSVSPSSFSYDDYDTSKLGEPIIYLTDNDHWNVSIETTDADLSEVEVGNKANPGEFTLTRHQDLYTDTTYALDVWIEYSGSAILDTDYSGIVDSDTSDGKKWIKVTIPAGQASVVIPIAAIDDSEVENPETETVTLTILDPKLINKLDTYDPSGTISETVEIADNDFYGTFKAEVLGASEIFEDESAGSQTTTIRFTRDGDQANLSNPVTLAFQLGGDAEYLTDYAFDSPGIVDVSSGKGTIVFAANQSSIDVILNAENDLAFDPDELLTVTPSEMGSTPGYEIDETPATVTIKNVLLEVRVEATDNNASEADSSTTPDSGHFTFNTDRNLTQGENVTVYFQLSGAASTADFSLVGANIAPLVWDATNKIYTSSIVIEGSDVDEINSATVEVKIDDDDVAEKLEDLVITITSSNPLGGDPTYSIDGEADIAHVYITDNDVAQVYLVEVKPDSREAPVGSENYGKFDIIVNGLFETYSDGTGIPVAIKLALDANSSASWEDFELVNVTDSDSKSEFVEDSSGNYALGTINLTAQTSTIELRPVNDDLLEGTEYANLSLQENSDVTQAGYSLDTNNKTSTSITIEDNDNWLVSIEAIDDKGDVVDFGKAYEKSIKNDTIPAQFKISRVQSDPNEKPSLEVWVEYSGVAALDTDYQITNFTQLGVGQGKVTIPEDEDYVILTVTPIDDMEREVKEDVLFRVLDPVDIEVERTYAVDQSSSDSTIYIYDGDGYVITSVTDVTTEESCEEITSSGGCRCECTSEATDDYTNITIDDGHPDGYVTLELEVDGERTKNEWLIATWKLDDEDEDISYIDVTSSLDKTGTATTRLAHKFDVSGLSSGEYEYTVTFSGEYLVGTTDDNTYTFTITVINPNDSAGNGSIPGVYNLISTPDGGFLLDMGDGTGDYFASPSTDTYTPPAGTYSSLEKIGNTYVLTEPNGNSAVFDLNGVMTSRRSAMGQETVFSYVDTNSDGIGDRLDEITLPSGKSIAYSYNATSGLLESITDEDGRVTSYTYVSGMIDTVTHPDPDGPTGPLLGNVITYNYEDGRVTSVSNTSGLVTSYERDSFGYITKKTSPDGSFMDYVPYSTVEISDGGAGTEQDPTIAVKIDGVIWGKRTTLEGVTTKYATDEFGNITREMDALDNVTTYLWIDNLLLQKVLPPRYVGDSPAIYTYEYYPDSNNLKTETLPDGSQRTWENYNNWNIAEKYTDANGNVTLYDYDANFRWLLSETRVLGFDDTASSETDDLTTSYTYYPAPTPESAEPPIGLLKSMTDPNGVTTEYEYNQYGDLTKTIFAVGTIDEASTKTLYTYDPAGNTRQVWDELDHETVYEYDALDRVTKITYPDPDGPGNPLVSPITTYEYHQNGNIKVENNRGRLTTYTYDPTDGTLKTITEGNPTETANDPDITVHSATTTYEYNDFGQVTSITNPLGNETVYKYDDLNRLEFVVQPAPDASAPMIRPETQYSYHPDGQIKSETLRLLDPQGNLVERKTEYKYDNYGVLETTYLPDPDGESIGLPRLSTKVHYDILGNLEWSIDTNGLTSYYNYDSEGRLDSATNSWGETKYKYDEADRLLEEDGPDYLLTTYTYNGVGQVKTMTTPKGTTVYGYDNRYRQTSITLPDPDGTGVIIKSSTVYDEAGRIQSETDANGNTTTYKFDALDRLTKIIEPDPDGVGLQAAPVTQYKYNDSGQITLMIDPRGGETVYKYNGLGWKIKETLPDPDDTDQSPAPVMRYVYDAAGQLNTMIDPLGFITEYKYDGLGRQTMVILPDPDGEESKYQSPTTTYEYNLAGEVTKITDAIDQVVEYTYDGMGRLKTETLPFDIDGSGTLTVTYTYRPDGRLERIDESDPDGTGPELGAFTEFEYTDRGERKSVETLDGITTYVFDPLGRNVQITKPDPDGPGNIQASQTTYFYDEVGDLTKVYDGYRAPWQNVNPLDIDGDGVTGTKADYDAFLLLYGDSSPESYDPDHPGIYGDINGDGKIGISDFADFIAIYGQNLEYPDERTLAGNITLYDYDNLGRLKKMTDAEGGETSYTYDANGNRRTLTDPEGNKTEWFYDALNRVKTETNELGDSRHYQYDAVGNLEFYVDREGRGTLFTYDHLQRRTHERWLTENWVTQNWTAGDWLDVTTVAALDAIRTFTYEFDDNSRLRSATDSEATANYTFEYDNLGRVKSTLHDLAALGFDVEIIEAYDGISRRTDLDVKINGTDDLQNDYDYDFYNRMIEVEQGGVAGGNSVAKKRVDFTYDQQKRLEQIGRYEGLTATDPFLVSRFEFDNAGQIKKIDHQAQGYDAPEYIFSWANITVANTDYEYESISDGETLIDFGTTKQLHELGRTFEITNTGTEDLELGTITVPIGFYVFNLASTTIAPGTSATLVLGLKADTVGTFTGQVKIESNDSDDTEFVIEVTGEVTTGDGTSGPITPKLTLLDSNGVEVAAGGTLDLGTSTEGYDITQELTIRNDGGLPLAIPSSITTSTGIATVQDVAGTLLAPGETATLTLHVEQFVLPGPPTPPPPTPSTNPNVPTILAPVDTEVVYGDTVTLKFEPVSGYSGNYYIRMDTDNWSQQAPGFNHDCSVHYFCIATSATEVTVPVTPGEDYHWWVHKTNYGTAAQADFSVEAELPPATYLEQITIASNDPNQAAYTINVSGQVDAINTIVVNSTRDLSDNNIGNGTAWTGYNNSEGDAEVTLRAAIQEANASSGPDRIVFDIPNSDAGYSSGIFTIDTWGGLPEITGQVIIDGLTQSSSTSPTIQLRGQDNLVFQAETDFSHQRGRLDGDGWSASTNLDSSGYLAYGPYTSEIAAGQYTATFRMQIDSPSGTNQRMVKVDVYDSSRSQVLASQDIYRNAFSAAYTYQDFNLNFTSQANSSLEFRVYWDDRSYIKLDSVEIAPQGSTTQAGLSLAASDSIIRGLSVTGFDTHGIVVSGNNNRIESNYVGVDPSGQAAPNLNAGIHITGTAAGNVIGTNGDGVNDASEGNVLSGNGWHGILIDASGASPNWIAGNIIGTDPTGTSSVPNQLSGIEVDQSGGNLFGTNSDGMSDGLERNLILGNTGSGIHLFDAWGNTIKGNVIGVADDGVTALPNGTDGILVSGTSSYNIIGSDDNGVADTLEGNVIANHTGTGISVVGASAINNRISRNLVYANGYNIDLGGDGATANDTGDSDTGANRLQNTPIITSWSDNKVYFTVDSEANRTYVVQVFGSINAGTSGQADAETYLGYKTISTDSAGSYSGSLDIGTGNFNYFSALAIDVYYNTSELSAAFAHLGYVPPSGDPPPEDPPAADPDWTTLDSYEYVYDSAGRLVRIDSPYSDSATFKYDATNQLKGADWDEYTQDENYSYDANGNRTNTGYQTGENNQLDSDGVFTYLYDDEGNRKGKTHIVTGELTEYKWDHRNRLESIVTKDSSDTIIHQVDYTYDVFNRRVVKTIDPDGAGPGTATQDVYIYDGLRSERGNAGDHILLAFDENDALTNRYLHGPAVDQVLADEQVDSLATEGDTLWTVTDHLGSIRHLVDYDPVTEITEVVNSLQYDSFGNITQETNETIDHLFAFTGRERDEESDLQYNRARYFDAAVGRWISEDPIGFAASDENLYRYAGNSSPRYTDPSGLYEKNTIYVRFGHGNNVKDGIQRFVETNGGANRSCSAVFGVGCSLQDGDLKTNDTGDINQFFIGQGYSVVDGPILPKIVTVMYEMNYFDEKGALKSSVGKIGTAQGDLETEGPRGTPRRPDRDNTHKLGFLEPLRINNGNEWPAKYPANGPPAAKARNLVDKFQITMRNIVGASIDHGLNLIIADKLCPQGTTEFKIHLTFDPAYFGPWANPLTKEVARQSIWGSRVRDEKTYIHPHHSPKGGGVRETWNLEGKDIIGTISVFPKDSSPNRSAKLKKAEIISAAKHFHGKLYRS